MPQEVAAPTGSDLRVTRRFEVWQGGTWQSLELGSTAAKVGDRVRQVATVTAARDFDFVSLRLPLPACFAAVLPCSKDCQVPPCHTSKRRVTRKSLPVGAAAS